MKKLVAVTALLATIALGSAALGVVGYSYAHAPSGPTFPGKAVSIQGLHTGDAVSIVYDGQGSPHVYASSVSAGYAGVCYAQASQRLWQMDFLRRAAEGTLSAILGAGPQNALVQQDEAIRGLDLSELAQQHLTASSFETRHALASCTLGINSVILNDAATRQLPQEFSLLNYRPTPWQATDSMAIMLSVASSLDTQIWATKLTFAALAEATSPTVAASLIPTPPESPSLFTASGTLSNPDVFLTSASATSSQRRLAMTQENVGRSLNTAALTRLLPAGSFGRASNNVVIDGTLTTTGMPIVENDPHLLVAVPSTLLYVQLIVPSANVSLAGYDIAGVPIWLTAHTATWADGVTFLNLDDTDVYIEQSCTTTSGATGTVYRGGCVATTIRSEVIQIAGQVSQRLTIRTTPHGSVLQDFAPALGLPTSPLLTLRSTIASPQWSADGFFALPYVHQWTGFLTAVQHISVGLNFVFADNGGTHGHIGYAASGLVPLRSTENTITPVSGADGRHEWTGFAPSSVLPSVYNPPHVHLIATSNNRILPDDAHLYLSNDYDLPWRAEETYHDVASILASGRKISPLDVERIQDDTQSRVDPQLSQTLLAALSTVGLPRNDGLAATSERALAAWNGDTTAQSQGAAVFETLWSVLTRDAAEAAMGPQLYASYATNIFITAQWQATGQGLQSGTIPSSAVQLALAETDTLFRTAGDTSPPTWGALHTLTYNQPLAVGLDPSGTSYPQYAIGTFPRPGDPTTLNIGGWFTGIGDLAFPTDQLVAAGGIPAAFAQDAAPTIRVVWDLADQNVSLGVMFTGAAGEPGPHYADQAALWREGSLQTLVFL